MWKGDESQLRLTGQPAARKFRPQSQSSRNKVGGKGASTRLRRGNAEPAKPSKQTPIVIGACIAAVLLIGVLVVLRPKDKASESQSAEASKKAVIAKSVEKKPSAKNLRDSKSEKIEKVVYDFKNGAPELPEDLGQALAMIQAYETQKKDDLSGLVKLYSDYIDRLPASADTRDHDDHLAELKKKLETRTNKRAKVLLAEVKAYCAREDYSRATKLCKDGVKALKADNADQDLIDSIELEISSITEQEVSNTALNKVFKTLPKFDAKKAADNAVLTLSGKALYEHRDEKDLPAYKRLHKRAMAERSLLRKLRYKKALKRLEAARNSVTSDASDFKKALGERLKLARERTKQSPFEFAGGSHVIDLRENRYTLSAKGGRIEAGFRFGIRPKMTARVLRQACRPNNIDDLIQLLVFSLKYDQYKDATFAHKKINKYDPELGKLLPDLVKLKGRAKLFSGSPIPGKKTPGSLYNFAKPRSPDVLGDWTPYDSKTKVKLIPKKGLQVTGEDLNLIMKEVGFKDGLSVEFDWPISEEIDGLVSLGLDILGKKGIRVAAYVSSKNKSVQLVTGKAGEEFAGSDQWMKGTGKETIRLTARGNTAILKVGNSVQRVQIPPFKRVVVELDGVVDARSPSQSMIWPSLKIEGKARDNWKRKNRVAYKQSVHNATLRFQQAREKLRRIQRQKASGQASEKKDLLPSTDDAFCLSSLNKKEMKAYKLAWEDFEEGNIKEAFEAFETFISTHEHLPGPYLAQSIIYLVGERYKEAEKHLDSALSIEPDFPEALIFRARMNQAFGKTEEAVKDLTRVLELAPDSSIGYRQRGMLALENDDLEGAEKDLAVAVDLDPTDVETYRHYLSVKQVAEGPPWEKTYVHESTHFTVKTNISQKRAKEVSDMLEKARMYYATVVPDTTVGKKAKKAVCLVFDTDIGLFNYSALMFGEKHDPQVLGLYTPFYKQLLFFEDKNDVNGDEFRHVLYHEGFHRYSDEVMPGLPIWMDEGLAEFLAGELSTNNGILEGRLSNLEDGFKYGIIPSVGQLFIMSQSEFYDENGPFNYAAGWALCRYLVRGNAKERERFKALILRLQKREPYYLALVKTFENVDFEDLDRRWRNYVKQMRR
ncbi:MAG: tetratricopeptide repeat protein [Planctomycetota bacterium]|nr:tetratricopeptide repeat protein [Planctomycetota bacterium]